MLIKLPNNVELLCNYWTTLNVAYEPWLDAELWFTREGFKLFVRWVHLLSRYVLMVLRHPGPLLNWGSNQHVEDTGWLLKGLQSHSWMKDVDPLSTIGNGKSREYQHPPLSPPDQRERLVGRTAFMGKPGRAVPLFGANQSQLRGGK